MAFPVKAIFAYCIYPQPLTRIFTGKYQKKDSLNMRNKPILLRPNTRQKFFQKSETKPFSLWAPLLFFAPRATKKGGANAPPCICNNDDIIFYDFDVSPTGDYLHDAHVFVEAGLHEPQVSVFNAFEANVENCLTVLSELHFGHFISASDEDTNSSNLSLHSKQTN